MDIELALAVFGVAVGVLGVAFAAYLAKKSEKRKVLVFNTSRSLELARVLPETGLPALSILYEQPGRPPLNLEGAYLHFIRIANFGREAILKDDVAAGDRLRLIASKGRVLDITIAGITLEVINFRVNAQHERPHEFLLTFDFLDYLDGVVLRVLSDTSDLRMEIEGTIVGMPEGIKFVRDDAVTEVKGIGCVFMLIPYLISFAISGYVLTEIGDWSDIWILFVLLEMFALPTAIVVTILLLTSSRAFTWPANLITEQMKLANRTYLHRRERWQ